MSMGAGNEAAAALDEAARQWREGALDRAEAIYRRLIEEAPGVAGAHHWLGLLLKARGEAEAGIAELREACRIDPWDPAARLNFGAMLFEAGEFAESAAQFEAVLVMRPDLPLALRNLGMARLALGEVEAAHAALSRGVAIAPDDPHLRFQLGRAEVLSGRPRQGLEQFAVSRRLDPANLDAAVAMSRVAQDLGYDDQAVAGWREALRLQPDRIDALVALARLLMQRGAAAEAVSLLDRAADLAPRSADIMDAQAWVRRALGDRDGADAIAREAAALDPGAVTPRTTLALLALDRNDDDAASAWVAEALVLAPDDLAARSMEAALALRQGDLERGLALLECRLEAPRFWGHAVGGAEWRGEDLAGRHLLVEGDQGFGDVIQYARYLPLLAARGARIALRVAPPLHRLLGSLTGVARILDPSEPPGAFDYRVDIGSLAQRFGTTLATIPAELPYLSPDPAVAAAWRARIGPPAGRLRVGLVWAGNPSHLNDCHRSAPVEALAPLAALPGIDWYSLQADARSAELARFRGEITDLRPFLTDFAETAGALAALDLLVAVDTSIVHLAGALGRPVRLLLPFSAEWRWLKDREDSPWYPTVRLRRQPRFGDWDGLIERVAEELREIATVPPTGARAGFLGRLFPGFRRR
jgi:tetratricopeptide (TPR) repeat protein